MRKQYLDKNLDTSNINIIAMAISDKKLLMNEISKYKEHYEVLCVVGTYDPKILNIPYISIAKIFDTPVDKLPMLLALEDMEVSNDVDFDAMYEYLQDQLTYVDINVLKEYMPPILRKVKRLVPDFTINEEVGLFMHISCAINRIKADEPVLKNIHKEAVLNRNKRLYHSLKEVLLPLEKAVDFKFNDDELATIVEIIK